MLKRITPLTVVDDLAAASAFYAALGAVPQQTDSLECIGYRTPSGTGIIVTTRAEAARSYGAAVADQLAERGALYCHQDLPSIVPALSNATRLAVYQHPQRSESVWDTPQGLIILVSVQAAA